MFKNICVKTSSHLYIRRAKLLSNRHHQHTNSQVFTGPMPFLSPNQQCLSQHRKEIRNGSSRHKILLCSEALMTLKSTPHSQGCLQLVSHSQSSFHYLHSE